MKYFKSQTLTTSEECDYEFTDRDRLFTADEVEELKLRSRQAGFIAGVSAKVVDSAAQFANLAINWVADKAMQKIETMLKKA